jgi:hypothetical protein
VAVKIVKNKGIKYWKMTNCFTTGNCVRDGNGKLFLRKSLEIQQRGSDQRKLPEC